MKKKILLLVVLLLILALPAMSRTLQPGSLAAKAQPLFLGYLDAELLSGSIPDIIRASPTLNPLVSTSFTWAMPNQPVSIEHFAPDIIISQTEPSIAVSPKDPNVLVASYHDLFPTPDNFACAFSFSNDGGTTWQFGGAVPLVKPSDFCSDPAVAADANGNFYIAYLSVRSSVSTTDVVVAKSTNGGHTFPTFQVAVHGISRVTFPDKDYITVDATTGPFLGNVYVTYTEFSTAFPNGAIRLVKSTTALGPFTTPITIEAGASPGHVQNSLPFVAPDGSVYVTYMKIASTGLGPTNIRIARSTNGGTSFSSPVTVSGSSRPTPGQFRLANGDPNFGIIPLSGFRSNSGPTAAVAPDSSAIYVAWTEFPSLSSCTPDGTVRPPCTDSNIVFSRSLDALNGQSWTSPIVANDDGTTRDQFFPWLTVQPNGVITIIFGDKRLDPSNIVYNVFSASSSNAGASFLANVRVTDASSDPAGSTFIGDYFNDASSGARVNAIWTDRRFGNEDIFASRTL